MQARPAAGTGQVDAQHVIFPAHHSLRRDHHDPLGELEGQVDALGQARSNSLADHEPVNDRLDTMDLGLGKLGRLFGYLDNFAVHSGTDQPRAADRLEDLEVLSFASAHARAPGS